MNIFNISKNKKLKNHADFFYILKVFVHKKGICQINLMKFTEYLIAVLYEYFLNIYLMQKFAYYFVNTKDSLFF